MGLPFNHLHRGLQPSGTVSIAPWWQCLWPYLGAPFVSSSWIASSTLKVWMLRLFGARVGRGVTVSSGLQVKCPWHLTVGDYSSLGSNLRIENLAPVTIADQVCLAQGVSLCTGYHRPRPICIQTYSWLASQASLGPGVTVGEGAILNAGAVAIQSLQPWTIYSGNPAHSVQKRLVV
jgi:putative colanic acid biosynthesis acetyltransferase WcaF